MASRVDGLVIMKIHPIEIFAILFVIFLVFLSFFVYATQEPDAGGLAHCLQGLRV